MNKQEKAEFVTSLCNAVRDHLLKHANAWPEEWDGHELRALIAQSFQSEVTASMRDARKRRRREFDRVLAVSNVL